jgi:hypothetical protein
MLRRPYGLPSFVGPATASRRRAISAAIFGAFLTDSSLLCASANIGVGITDRGEPADAPRYQDIIWLDHTGP